MKQKAEKHEHYMRMALELANKARGRTSPNPMVGAVLVKKGRVVGRGYHRKAGQAHAEVLAMSEAGPRTRGATLYINLEPCSHQGRTAPCAPQVAAAGIARVVAAMKDPNPEVSGNGFAFFKSAGVEVATGVLESEACKLNEFYIKHITTAKPFVILKGAMTLDGKTATARGESKWITGEQARRDVHGIRRDVDAVLVGIETLLKDDASLTCRLPGKPPQPYRIVLDGGLRTSPGSNLCRLAGDGKSIIITKPDADEKKAEQLEKAGCKVLRIRAGGKGFISIPLLLRELGGMGITSLMVEGGATVHDSFLRAGCVDKVVVYMAPKILGGAGSRTLVDGAGFSSLARAINLENLEVATLGRDLKIQGYPQK